MKRTIPIISGVLIVSGLCMAGASAADFGVQVIVNGAGAIMAGAGLWIMTVLYG